MNKICFPVTLDLVRIIELLITKKLNKKKFELMNFIKEF